MATYYYDRINNLIYIFGGEKMVYALLRFGVGTRLFSKQPQVYFLLLGSPNR